MMSNQRPLIGSCVIIFGIAPTYRWESIRDAQSAPAGRYKVTHDPMKYCRTPLGFLMEYHRPGIRGAAEMSFRFSVFCVGCCWALFAVIVVVGSMNIL